MRNWPRASASSTVTPATWKTMRSLKWRKRSVDWNFKERSDAQQRVEVGEARTLILASPTDVLFFGSRSPGALG
jgi:hypothetical protein